MPYTKNDHTFVICAYEESPYLEGCIQSIFDQIIQGAVSLSTSTPNTHIKQLAKKYNIPLYTNTNGGDIASDFNFAYSCAKTGIVTIAHQDDVYLPEYLDDLLKNINAAKKPLIFFSNYTELKNEKPRYNNILLRIKSIMLFPLKYRTLQTSKFIRRLILSFGNPICCPSVSFIKGNLPKTVFEKGYLCNVDWQAWEKISKISGSFVYSKNKLLYHRIHKDSATSKNIQTNIRSHEDFDMLCKFWPEMFAKLLSKVYGISVKYNKRLT